MCVAATPSLSTSSLAFSKISLLIKSDHGAWCKKGGASVHFVIFLLLFLTVRKSPQLGFHQFCALPPPYFFPLISCPPSPLLSLLLLGGGRVQGSARGREQRILVPLFVRLSFPTWHIFSPSALLHKNEALFMPTGNAGLSKSTFCSP